MAHLKRLTAPDSWGISKKENKYITRPNPGPHKLNESIPLNLVVKKLLNAAKTTLESKKIIVAGKILVDKRPRKDIKFPLGLMDIIEIPDTKESFIVLLDDYGKFKLSPIKNSNSKYFKIINKTTLKGKKIQLNLKPGRNIIVDKDAYKVGDTITIDLSSNKIKSHLKLEKDSLAYITAGKYIGKIVTILEIHKFKMAKDTITIKLDNNKYETLKDYAFVVDNHFVENDRKQ